MRAIWTICMLIVGLTGWFDFAAADKIAEEDANEVVQDSFSTLRKNAFDRLILCIHHQAEPVLHGFWSERNVRPIRLDNLNVIRGRIRDKCGEAIKNYRNLYPKESKEQIFRLIDEEVDHAIEDTERIDFPGHA